MAFPDGVPTLSRGDVTLRAHRPDDAEAVVEQCVDPVSVQWTTAPSPYTKAMADEFIGRSVPSMWDSGHENAFAIECTHPDGRRRFSGTVSLRHEGARRAEIAFGAHPAVRGRGVMSSAVAMLLDWGFAERGLETVLWLANDGNFASRRVAWRSGFTFGGTVRRWLDHRGEYPDAWVGALHRDDPRVPTCDWHDAPRITGERVVLRPLRDEDTPRIVEACSDERTAYWLGFLPSPYREGDAQDFLLRMRTAMAQGTQVQWAVADPSTDELIGNVGFPRMHGGNAEVGYWTHPTARGRRVMTEAVSLALGHAFGDRGGGGLGLQRVFARSAAENTASQQVARANGFVQTGVDRQSERLGDGSYADMVRFDLLRSEWAAAGVFGNV